MYSTAQAEVYTYYIFLLFFFLFFPVIAPLFSFFSSAHMQQRMLGSCHSVKCTVQIMWVFFSRDLLGGEESWPFLLASNVVPALIQLTALPWLPESPRYLLIDRGDEESCISGEFRVTVILSLSMRSLTGRINSQRVDCIFLTYSPAGWNIDFFPAQIVCLVTASLLKWPWKL